MEPRLALKQDYTYNKTHLHLLHNHFQGFIPEWKCFRRGVGCNNLKNGSREHLNRIPSWESSFPNGMLIKKPTHERRTNKNDGNNRPWPVDYSSEIIPDFSNSPLKLTQLSPFQQSPPHILQKIVSAVKSKTLHLTFLVTTVVVVLCSQEW